jgi:DNA-binding LacI/PurR family transcriptional regulator
MLQIAAHLGLSKSAVSLALRDSPRVSEATRARVRQVAAKLGYRPDPQVVKLMHHLRQRTKAHFKSVIVALTSIPESEERPYHRLLRQGAQQRADSLGYKFEITRITAKSSRDAALQRVLTTRGIEGILLLPMREAVPLTNLLDWKRFSVVSATRGIPEPTFHRVAPDHFRNSLLVCDQLQKLGYHRIGLAADRGFDLSTTPGLVAGVIWQPVQGRTEPIPPLLYNEKRPRGVSEWFEKERPDAIVVCGVPDAEAILSDLGLTTPGPVGIAVTNLEGTSMFAGVNGRAFEIGSAAIDQLSARMQANERGVPSVPTETTIVGSWVRGKSLPTRAGS